MSKTTCQNQKFQQKKKHSKQRKKKISCSCNKPDFDHRQQQQKQNQEKKATAATATFEDTTIQLSKGATAVTGDRITEHSEEWCIRGHWC